MALVFGIAATADLLSKLIAGSGMQGWLLLHQLSIPGGLWIANALSAFGYGLGVLAFGAAVARGYWRALFPSRLRWDLLVVSLAAGGVFAIFLNHPAHVLLFGWFFDHPVFDNGNVSDSVIGGIFDGIAQSRMVLTMPMVSSLVLSPLSEELTDRGILFKEAEGLTAWQVALLSVVVFCLAHYTAGGIAKSLAVLPAAVLLVGVRIFTGSFVYSAAAHAGLNAAALLKLQVF